ncbi:hypothetical protein PMIN06_002972 [Paraphaeosphaeria minitans]
MRDDKRKLAELRREEMRTAIRNAADLKATSLEQLKKIVAQNQFADRFTGILELKAEYTFDPNGRRGPSQTVSYTSRFVVRLSDVTEDMCISGSLSIKAGKIGGSGKGSFVDSDKLKQSDLNFYISVKVVNQTINFKDALAEAKVALTVGPIDLEAQANVGIARSNLETNTETTIQVSWSGGGHIKPMEQQWDIPSLMQAAARFPDLVADCPQRTYAILGRYETLRSFVDKAPAACSPLQYENAQIYTNALLDSFMSYKAMYKTIGENIFAIQGKTMEIKKREGNGGGNSSVRSKKDVGEKTETGSNDVTKKDPNTTLSAYVEDLTPFEDSIKGLSDARMAIRRQMARIVKEVDVIEADPKIATDETHNEPFQSPLAFETRLPTVDLPARLKPRPYALTGAAIRPPMPLTPEEADRQEQKDQETLDATPLAGLDVTLSTEEIKMFGNITATRRGIGRVMRVTSPAGSSANGVGFNNLDILQPMTLPEWVVTKFLVQIYKGHVCYVSTSYENGFLIEKGVVSELGVMHS